MTAVLALAVLVAAPGAAAKFGSSDITTEEAEQYVAILFTALGGCNAEWLREQFVPGAVLQYVHADGRQETVNPSSYGAEMREFCHPYRYIKWDRQSRQISSTGYVTTIRWDMAWGGYERDRAGRSKVTFENWAELVKHGQRIQVAGAGWVARELVDGAEKEFFIKTYEGRLAYQLDRFFSKLTGSYDRVKQRLSEWSRKRREAVDAKRNETH